MMRIHNVESKCSRSTERTSLVLVLALMGVLLWGCGTTEQADDGSPCGSGEEARVDGRTFCVYKSAIIEKGFACPPELSVEIDLGDGKVCADGETLSAEEEEALLEVLGQSEDPCRADGLGCPDMGMGGDAGSDETDTGEGEVCFDAWQSPRIEFTAPGQPNTQSSGMNLVFEYGIDGTGEAFIELSMIGADDVVIPSDGPFSPGVHSGSWLELQDANGQAIYTRLTELVPEFVEAPGENGGFEQIPVCPTAGQFRISNLERTVDADDVVLFAEPIDGEMTFQTSELARFPLP